MKKVISFFAAIIMISMNGIAAGAVFHDDSGAIERAANSVVKLTCFSDNGEAISTGSGFLAFEEGVIITNYHVIDGEVSFIVATTEDGSSFSISELICASPSEDIAILRSEERIALPLLSLGDSSSVHKGSRVVAIGSPLGLLNTVSEGIYSGEIIDGATYILFTAAISSGSSGGALFDDDGKVIGVTAATYTEGQNLNLAVPINLVKKLWSSYQNDYASENISGDITEEQKTPERAVSVGDEIIFGSYEQDNILSNGQEPIEWVVLDVQDGKILVISKYGLDYQPFEGSFDTSWKNSFAREWLNNDFINDAFSPEERGYILATYIPRDINPNYDTSSENDTTDQLFLLSIDETKRYFSKDLEAFRKCKTTAYSKGKIIWHFTDNEYHGWYLRTPGSVLNVAVVTPDDEILYGGINPSTSLLMRPAMWLDIQSGLPEISQKRETDEETGKRFGIGEYRIIGHYEQDNDLSNGEEPIIWQIIDTQDNRQLLVSKYALDTVPYMEYQKVSGDITWDRSTLRTWLNEEFYYSSFSENEMAQIVLSDIKEDSDNQHNHFSGKETRDKVFLLSAAEAETLFSSDVERQCHLTDFAYSKLKGETVVDSRNNRCSWWLRTPGESVESAMYVNKSGEVIYQGNYVCMGHYINGDDGLVRPAMWALSPDNA